MAETYDIAIVGAGIAGASLAYALLDAASVVLLERETQPGYHSTGRSAATLLLTYGNDVIRRLTHASARFLRDPPAGFTETALLRPRCGLTIGSAEQAPLLQQEYARSKALLPSLRRLAPEEVLALVPLLKEEAVAAGAILDPEAQDMEVASLHQGYLKAARAAGTRVMTDAPVTALERRHDKWQIGTRGGEVSAALLVNAAGAWADELAGLAGLAPLGLQPKRRTAFTFKPPEAFKVDDWPLVIDVAESFYFKPEAGLLLGSPADETPSPACDARPEEMDIALGAYRIEEATGHPIRRLEHSWAGLRTFAADKTPVLGFDPRTAGFFWLAGQGGYGIMTSPAMAELAAAQILGRGPNGAGAGLNLDAALSPGRLL